MTFQRFLEKITALIMTHLHGISWLSAPAMQKLTDFLYSCFGNFDRVIRLKIAWWAKVGELASVFDFRANVLEIS